MQSVKKDIRNVREADSITTLSNDQSSHKCGFHHQVYPSVTIAYNSSKVFYKVKQCSAIPAALQWVEVTDITLAVEQGGSVNCVKHVKHESSSYIIVGGESPDRGGVVWIICIKSGRLIRNCFTTSQAVTTLSCYSSPTLLSSPGLVLVLGTLNCHLYISHLNPLTSPNSKQKLLLPTTFLEDISATTLGSTTHPCFEVGAKARVKGVWNYMLPGMKSSGVFRDGRVTSVELLDSMGCIVAGFSNGGWQIWSVAGSKAVLQFTSSLQPNVYPVTNFCLLVPENDPHHILYLWVTHSRTELTETADCPTTATMYQLRFRNMVVGSKPGVNDQYRRIESLIQSFTFNLSQPMFIGKESGTFQKLVDFEAIQRVNYLQGCNDFNGVVISLDTTKFIITVLFDLNAWYFAQMPGSPNQVARLSPYISYLPLEKTSMPSYCCLQAVKVKAQSLFRGKLSSSEACNVFPCSLNTIVRYHIGKNIVNAFYFPTNELVLDPGNSVQGLVDLALKGIFTKHNTLVQSKKGRLKVLEFLTTFLPNLKRALNDAMNPMLSGLPTADTELKNLRELLSVTSHCIHLGNKLRKALPDKDSYGILYQHTYQYARTVLALTDMRILPSCYAFLQDFGCRMLPLRFTAIGELLDNISGLSDLWEDEMFPPKSIRSLLNVFYTKPLDLTLQGYIVAYSVLYLKDNIDIRNLNTLSGEDADAISSIFYLDRRDYKKFIKYLPSKSGVFVYCNINSICDILLQQKKRDVAIQMLMVLDESYVSHYSPRTMSLLADMLSSEYKINLISSGATDLLAFSAVLDEQLSHKQFVSLLKSLDNQERFDCLFYLILKKNKLCDLLSAYGETKHAQKSSSQFLEFMFLYTIKHFSDVELKVSITACQGNLDSKERFNKNIPLSAQKCQNDISVLSKFCLKTDLGNFKLGSSPKAKKSVSDTHVARTPPPKSLDVSDDLLLQLRTPHPTPLKEKVLTALEAPRSILRSSKTERKNRKRIRFDDPSDALPESKPTRLSFGGVEFSEPNSSSSPTKKLTFDEDITQHEGVSLADISPPKPIIESVVQYDDTIGDDEQIPVLQELSNDSISFEIFGAKTLRDPDNVPTEPSEISIEIPDEIADISEIAEFSPIVDYPSSLPDQTNKQVADESLVELSMEESFVSAASAESQGLSQISDQFFYPNLPETDVLVHSSVDAHVAETSIVSIGDSSLEEIPTSPASPDVSPVHSIEQVGCDVAATKGSNVISLDSSTEVLEIESADEEEGEDEEEDSSSEEGEKSDGNEQAATENVKEVSQEEEEEVEDEQEKDDMVLEKPVERQGPEDDVNSERSTGSVQVIGIDSSNSDIEDEQNRSTNSVPSNETSGILSAGSAPEETALGHANVEAALSDGSGSIQVIGIDSHSEVSGDDSGDSGSESDEQSVSSHGGDIPEQDPGAMMVEQDVPKEDQESEDEAGEISAEEGESGSESSGPVVLDERESAVEEDVNSGTEADTESSDGEEAASDNYEDEKNENTGGDNLDRDTETVTAPGDKVLGDEIHELPDDDDPSLDASSAVELLQSVDEDSEEDEDFGKESSDEEIGETVPIVQNIISGDEVHVIPSEDDPSLDTSAAMEHCVDEIREGDVNSEENTSHEDTEMAEITDHGVKPSTLTLPDDEIPCTEIYDVPDEDDPSPDNSIVIEQDVCGHEIHESTDANIPSQDSSTAITLDSDASDEGEKGAEGSSDKAEEVTDSIVLDPSVPTEHEGRISGDEIHVIPSEDDHVLDTAVLIEHGADVAESSVNVPDFQVHETGSVVMVLDSPAPSAESADPVDYLPTSNIEQVSEDEVHVIPDDGSSPVPAPSAIGEGFHKNIKDPVSDHGGSEVEHDESPDSSSDIDTRPSQGGAVNKVQFMNSSGSNMESSDHSVGSSYEVVDQQGLTKVEHDPPIQQSSSQEDDSFVSATTEAIAEDADAGPSDVGQILESDDSDGDEEFTFEVPEQVVPHSTWFMETFPDHDKLSFDFNAPHKAALATHRTTRSRARKLRPVGTEDVLPPPVPLIKVPSPPLSMFPVIPMTSDAPPSEALSISTIDSAFSPEQPKAIHDSEQQKSQVSETAVFTSPFSASLAQFIPERSCPKYQLSKTEDGTLKLENVNPGPAAEIFDISGDTESLEGSEFQSFVSVDDKLEKSVEEQSSLPLKPDFDDVERDSSFQSIPAEAPLIEHIESDQTESLPSPGSSRDTGVVSEPELVNVPSVHHELILPDQQSTSSEANVCQPSPQVAEVAHMLHDPDSEPSEKLSSTDDGASDFTVISEPNIIAISETEIPRSDKNADEDKTLPTRNLRSRKDSKEVDSTPVPSLKPDQLQPEILEPEEDSSASQLNDSADESKNDVPEPVNIISVGRKTRKAKVDVEEPASSGTEKRPYRILRAPRMLQSQAAIDDSTTAKRPHKILRAPRTLRSQKQIVDEHEDRPVPNQRDLSSSADQKEESKSSAEESTSESHMSVVSATKVKSKPASTATRSTRRALRSRAEKTKSETPPKLPPQPLETSPESLVESIRKSSSPVPDSPPRTRRNLRSKTDKIESRSPKPSSPISFAQSEDSSQKPSSTVSQSPPKTRRNLRSKADKTESRSPPKRSSPILGVHSQQSSPKPSSPIPDSPPKTRRNLRSKADKTESVSTKKLSPTPVAHPQESSSKPSPPESPPTTRKTVRVRSKVVVAESRPGKGKLRPRQHTTSDSNNDEKPANKMRKSVSPREDWAMPVSPNKTKPPPITVTRSSRRLRTQISSSEFAAETSAQSTTAGQPRSAAPEITPVRVKRNTRGNKRTATTTSEPALAEKTPTVRLTRRRKNPSEPEVSPSRQSSDSGDSMPAKKSRSSPHLSTRRTRNANVRATPSTSTVIERRETRSTRKGSGK